MLPPTIHASLRPLAWPPAILAAAILAAGCLGSAKTRYFLLSPTATPTATAPATATAPGANLVAIRGCRLPDYLNRTEMITRKGQHEIVIRDFESWAQAPEKMIRRTLHDNLARIIGTDKVAGDRATRHTSDILLVDFEFNQLDPTTDGVLAVNVDCRLHPLPDRTEEIHNLAFTIPLAGKDGKAITAAVNQALARIAAETALLLK